MTPRIVQYCLVTSRRASEFERDVKLLLDNGWQPFGSISAIASSDGGLYVQPMVKYEKPPIEAWETEPRP